MLLQHLTYLSALAREQHFGRAAAACHVSQPTLSAGIKRLEEELGVPLVIRGRRYEGLTTEGHRMLEWVDGILADVDGMHRDLGAMQKGLGGRLRIGAIPTTLPILPLLTQPLCEAHPDLDVSIQSRTSIEIEQELRASRLDVGITYLDNEPLSHVRMVELYHERYVFMTPADGPYAEVPEISWSDAAQARLCLLSPDMQHRRILDRIFREAGAAPRPILETNSITTLYAHVRSGLGSGVLSHPWLHLFDVPAGLRAIPLVEPSESHAVGAVWLDRDPEPLLTHAFVAAAREAGLEAQLAGTAQAVQRVR